MPKSEFVLTVAPALIFTPLNSMDLPETVTLTLFSKAIAEE